MIIAVIGCDNSGKTTLCKRLSEEFGFEYYKSLGPDPKSLKSLSDKINLRQNVVMDRFYPIEEWICGKLFRHKSQVTLTQVRKWIRKIDLFIYCRPSMLAVKDFGSREQMEGVKEKIDTLREEYDSLFAKEIYNKTPFIIYDWEIDKNIDALKARLNWLRILQESQS